MNAASRRRIGGVVVLLLAALLGLAPSAAAAGSRVALLQPGGASPGARRCLRLIRDELTASGFEVTVQDAAADQDPLSLANAMRAQQGVVAAIGLLGAPESPRAELWILDRLGDKPEVRRLPWPTDEPERAAEVLAIRAVEVLRASALTRLIEANRAEVEAPASAPATPPPAPPPVAAPPAAPRAPVAATAAAGAPAAPRRRLLALETGVSVLSSPGELDPAAIPLVRVRLDFAGPWMARLTLAGLGTRPRVETVRGTAAVAQTVGLAELGYTFRRDRRLMPGVSLAGGVLRVASDARGTAPFVGQRAELWSAMAGAGAGVAAMMTQSLALSLEAHVLVASPYPVIRFVDWQAATLARPALWVTLSLVSWL